MVNCTLELLKYKYVHEQINKFNGVKIFFIFFFNTSMTFFMLRQSTLILISNLKLHWFQVIRGKLSVLQIIN